MRSRLLTAAVASAAVLASATVFHAQSSGVSPLTTPLWESCEELHDTYVRRFEASPGFGVSRMIRPMMLERSGTLDLGRERYSIQSLELVGVINRERMIAYVPVAHDNGLDSRDFKNRDLTPFETEAVAAFRSGRDIAGAAEPASKALLCAGALRAKPSCLACHKNKQAGDLLGAFSYRLTSSASGTPADPSRR
jgi:hypothetical protein